MASSTFAQVGDTSANACWQPEVGRPCQRFWKAFGAALLLVAVPVFVVMPMYSDIATRAETAEMLKYVSKLRREISEYAAQTGGLAGMGQGVLISIPQDSRVMQEVVIAPEGKLVAKAGNKGQIAVLVPTFSQGKLTWHCLGGRDGDVPSECRRRRGKE